MARRRLGVVLLIPPPVGREVDGLRRACGDVSLDRVPPHVTLVPPVNVREDQLGEVADVLGRAARATARPLAVRLGPPTTFLPDTPVLYLPVVEGADDVVALRDRVFTGPLARRLEWPFVPHVTLTQDVPAERIRVACEALAGYGASVAFDRLHLLEEGRDRVWRVEGEHPFAAPSVVGRGGLPLELTVTEEPDAAGRALAVDRPFAVTARREQAVVGVARGWSSPEGTAHLAELVVAESARRQGVGSHLLAAVEDLARDRGCAELLATVTGDATGEGFLRARGWADAPAAALRRPLAPPTS